MFTTVDKASETLAKNLDVVMKELEKRVIDYLNGITKGGVMDASALLNSQATMIQLLREAGYYELAAEHAATYEAIAGDVVNKLSKDGFPPAKFTTVEATTLRNIAAANIQGFEAVGVETMDALRLSLFRNAVNNMPFNVYVGLVRDTLEDKLKRYAYTYANTANLNFSGEVLRTYGEALGATEWEVVGPMDELTREVCVDALNDPIRTEKEWKSADYWGGTPGGWQCRHQLYPVV